MSFDEDDDDSDRDKNYEPPSSETDSSDDVPVFNEIQNEVSRNKTSAKTNSNGHELRLLEEDLFLSSDNDNIAGNQVGLDLQGTVGVRRKVKNKSISTQIGKKRVVHTSEWACNIQKRKYSAGEEYISKKGKVVPARIIKPPCSCRLKCSEKLLQSDRQEIFNAYWSQEKGNDTKRQFIVSCVEKHSTVRSRKRDLASNKSKQNTLQYYFTVKGIRTRVCKLMFLNTLSISNTVVVNVLKNIEPGGIVKTDQRGKQTPVNKTHDDTVESVVRHISSFPNYSSHYTREKSDMKYLGPHLNIEKMYELYVEDCNENDFNPLLIAKKWLYYDVFNKKFKLNFKPPEIDTCDTCDYFQAKLKNNLTLDEKNSIEEDHNAHLDESKLRYDLKSEDTKRANNTLKVLTGDLQKCLPSPLITNCISFYKRKLWTLNYTLFDSSDSSVHCIMWDESKGARGGNEIGSALLKWADTVIPGSDIEEIILWSDNCYGQNKNISLIMCFFWILNKYPQVKIITQKFLLKGHTHMEADTVHALIERKRKKLNNMTILTPWDWQQLVRQTSMKYTVHNMELEDFKNFRSLYDVKICGNPPFINRKKDVNKEQVLLSTCVQLQVKQNSMGTLFLKSNFANENQEIDLVRFRRRHLTLPNDLQLVTQSPIPISQQKYNDLLALLPYVPTVCHDFYKNLKHTSNTTSEYPEGDLPDDD